MIDQILWSLSNLALSISVARVATPEEFGAFGIGFALYLIANGISRALASTPLTIRFSKDAPDLKRSDAVAASTGTGLSLGFAATMLLLPLSLPVSNELGGVLRVFALLLPILLLQDCWRYACFACGKSSRAAAIDACWLVAQCVGVGVLTLGQRATVESMVLTWGLAAGSSAVLASKLFSIRQRPRNSVRWIRAHRDIGPTYVGEFLALTGGTQAMTFVIAAVTGLAGAAALRGAQMLLGPVTVILSGLAMAYVPETVQSITCQPTEMRRSLRQLSGFAAVAVLALGIALLSLPDQLGAEMLGESWPGTRSVLLSWSCYLAATALATGPGIGLRALADAAGALRIRLTVLPLLVGGGWVMAVSSGLTSAVWAMALANLLGAVLWWRRFDKKLTAQFEVMSSYGPPARRKLGAKLISRGAEANGGS